MPHARARSPAPRAEPQGLQKFVERGARPPIMAEASAQSPSEPSPSPVEQLVSLLGGLGAIDDDKSDLADVRPVELEALLRSPVPAAAEDDDHMDDQRWDEAIMGLGDETWEQAEWAEGAWEHIADSNLSLQALAAKLAGLKDSVANSASLERAKTSARSLQQRGGQAAALLRSRDSRVELLRGLRARVRLARQRGLLRSTRLIRLRDKVSFTAGQSARRQPRHLLPAVLSSPERPSLTALLCCCGWPAAQCCWSASACCSAAPPRSTTRCTPP